jgi:hypothetical protein
MSPQDSHFNMLSTNFLRRSKRMGVPGPQYGQKQGWRAIR